MCQHMLFASCARKQQLMAIAGRAADEQKHLLMGLLYA